MRASWKIRSADGSHAAAAVQDTPGTESEGPGFHVDEGEQQVAVFVERDGSGAGAVMVACANRQRRARVFGDVIRSRRVSGVLSVSGGTDRIELTSR